MLRLGDTKVGIGRPRNIGTRCHEHSNITWMIAHRNRTQVSDCLGPSSVGSCLGGLLTWGQAAFGCLCHPPHLQSTACPHICQRAEVAASPTTSSLTVYYSFPFQSYRFHGSVLSTPWNEVPEAHGGCWRGVSTHLPLYPDTGKLLSSWHDLEPKSPSDQQRFPNFKAAKKKTLRRVADLEATTLATILWCTGCKGWREGAGGNRSELALTIKSS